MIVKKVLALALCLAPNIGSATFFLDGMKADCNAIEGDYFARETCKCSKIESAVARLECFDKISVETTFLQSQADGEVQRLLTTPFGTHAIDKVCRQRSE